MAASSSECGRQTAVMSSHVSHFGHLQQHQRPDSTELYKQSGTSPTNHARYKGFGTKEKLFYTYNFLWKICMTRDMRRVQTLDRDRLQSSGYVSYSR
jgi:hypothetical protein